jgi:methionine biosynthesis protein MetW
MNAAKNILPTDRVDLEVIAGWIEPGEFVLDLGCGDGSLLRHLKDSKGVSGYGIEIEADKVVACIANGVNVLQIDLEKGLADFADGAFDHVVMSMSLQSVRHTEALLLEMLRVSRVAVVSFPNFGYRKNREAIAAGRMPVSKVLPYQWYDTPNVRFFTIADFEALCAERGIAILDRAAFDDDGRRVDADPNLDASLAMYRLGRAAA